MSFVVFIFHCEDTLLYILAVVRVYLTLCSGPGTLLRDFHSLAYLINIFNYIEASSLLPCLRNTEHFVQEKSETS